MKYLFRQFAYLLLALIIGNAVKAAHGCDCIAATSYPSPNNKIHYIIKCFFKGGDKLLEANDVNVEDANQIDIREQYHMEMYKIGKDDCVPLPNGRMILRPSS